LAKKKVAFYTLGCKVNQYESAVLARLFTERGYEVAEFAPGADVYVINTCAVTRTAERKSRQAIRRAVRFEPGAVIAVTGCYAQLFPGEVMKIPGVGVVTGTLGRAGLIDLVEKRAKNGTGPLNAVKTFGSREVFEELPCPPLPGRTRAYVKIQDGCESFCTYCLVPYARGPLRSRQPAKVLEEVQFLAAAGYKEIVLTGIHTSAYGRDLGGGVDLAGLLERVARVLPSPVRVRLSSLEPHEITPRLVEVLASSPLFCRHLHVPLQSGDDGVLRRMGRSYTALEYARTVGLLRQKLPGLGLTTDVMVGFPGEGDEQYANTYRFVGEMAFSRLHVFKYSPRPGTPAAAFPEQLPEDVKEERSERLLALGEKLAYAFAAAHLGKEVEVLAEEKTGEGYYAGFTDNYLRAVFSCGVDVRGEIVRICVEEALGDYVRGKMVF